MAFKKLAFYQQTEETQLCSVNWKIPASVLAKMKEVQDSLTGANGRPTLPEVFAGIINEVAFQQIEEFIAKNIQERSQDGSEEQKEV